MIVLFCQYFVPKNQARQKEVDLCFQKNIENPLIDKIIMYFEKKEDMVRIPEKKHIEKKFLPERLNYGFWLRETDKLKPGTLSILINSDIYLDDTLANFRGQFQAMQVAKTFIALTRYNPSKEGLVLNDNPHWTQDTWAVVKDHQPMPNALYQEAAFELGQPGCDNKIAYVMHSYGFRVTNPCHTIRSIHLQADEGRSYDAKASKLIGLHAFVHPTQSLLDQAVLDLDLLTRSPVNPVEINVNNWINGRESYRLNASEQFKNQVSKVFNTEDSNINTLPVTAEHRIDPETDINTKKVKTLNFDFSQYTLIKEFSARYKIFRDNKFYYCYDKYWPHVKTLPLAAVTSKQLNTPIDLFCLAFLPVDLVSEILTIADDFDHDQDWRFWQYPCRTEQDAAAVHKLLPYFFKDGATIHLYLALPWATIIDKEVGLQALQGPLGLLGARIKSAKDIVAAAGGTLQVHSICQHVFWTRLGPYAKTLGVTDFWISHKVKGKDTQDGFEGIRLHPWSLYAVNYREEGHNINFVYNEIKDRPVFASFNGAYMGHYISDVRKKLEALSSLPGYQVKIKDKWHFNDVVYKHQVLNDSNFKDSNNIRQTVQYNELMSQSLFSLCPSGAGPNSLRFWECLANGSIPVLLADTLELPNLKQRFPDLPVDWQDAVVFHPEADIASLDTRLRAITPDQQRKMQSAGLTIYKRCESMTCFGHVTRLVQPQAKLFSQKEVNEQVNTSEKVKPPEYATVKIALFKNQQLHLDGQTKPQLTGDDCPSPIALNMASGASVGSVWFDTAEKVYAINLYGAAELLDGLSHKLQGIIKYGKYQTFEYAANIRVNPEHLQLVIDDDSEKYLSLGLRFEFECNTPNNSQLTVDIDVLPNWMLYKLEYYDKTGTLYQLSELNSTRKDNLFDTENIENGRIIELIEQAKVKYKIQESKQQLFPKLPKRTNNLVGEPIKDGISLYVHLMNRNENVKKNLANWLTQTIDELILLDWSSEEPVADIPNVFEDPRVRVIRVDGQNKFVRTFAQNLATQMARYKKVFKCDSDVEFKGNFFAAHPLKEGEFWVGDWHQGRDFNERHLHGETYYTVDDFFRVNGYDERITAYGHDDTNLKDRMVLSGLIKKVFSYNYIQHQPHDQINRIQNQNIRHPMVKTYENRLKSNESNLWSQTSRLSKYDLLNKSEKLLIFKLLDNIKFDIDESIEERAVNIVAGWYIDASSAKKLSLDEKLKIIWKNQVE